MTLDPAHIADPASPVYATLDALGIRYETFHHPPVFNATDAAAHWGSIAGTPVKNLFLRNKKGNRQYLVILEIARTADLRALAKIIGDDRLSFGSAERLMATLGVTPGSVSPFGLIHDAGHTVRVIVDDHLRLADKLIFHPNINTSSVLIGGADFQRFLASTGHSVRFVAVG